MYIPRSAGMFIGVVEGVKRSDALNLRIEEILDLPVLMI
jgi:hypothetical protein